MSEPIGKANLHYYHLVSLKRTRWRMPDDDSCNYAVLPATPLSPTARWETGGFASPPCDGFALVSRVLYAHRSQGCGSCISSVRRNIVRPEALMRGCTCISEHRVTRIGTVLRFEFSSVFVRCAGRAAIDRAGRRSLPAHPSQSSRPRPFSILGACFSTRAARVADCFAAAKCSR